MYTLELLHKKVQGTELCFQKAGIQLGVLMSIVLQSKIVSGHSGGKIKRCQPLFFREGGVVN